MTVDQKIIQQAISKVGDSVLWRDEIRERDVEDIVEAFLTELRKTHDIVLRSVDKPAA